MFDFSFPEMTVALVVALVVLGPEKLPKVARTVGRWAGQARRYMRDLGSELERETQLADLKKQLQDVQQSVREAGDEVKRSLDDGASEARRNVNEALAPPPAASAQDASDTKPAPSDRP